MGAAKPPSVASAPTTSAADKSKAKIDALAYAEVNRLIQRSQGRAGQTRPGMSGGKTLPKLRLSTAQKTLLGQ